MVGTCSTKMDPTSACRALVGKSDGKRALDRFSIDGTMI